MTTTTTTPIFPCNLTLPNVVCVTATGRTDQLASFANTGPTTVDLAAPGVDILSTAPGGGYTSDSGTSFSAPMVTGAAALVLAANPTFTTAQLRDAILGGVQPLAALTGRVTTGGRLSLPGALGITPLPPPSGGGVVTPAASRARHPRRAEDPPARQGGDPRPALREGPDPVAKVVHLPQDRGISKGQRRAGAPPAGGETTPREVRGGHRRTP